MPSSDALNMKDVLDGLGHGVLIFNGDGDLVQHNRAAGAMFGADWKLLRDQGWKAAEVLFKPYAIGNNTEVRPLNDIRKEAVQSGRPVRFQILLRGEFVPCWASAVPAEKGELYAMLTIDAPDWSAMTDLVDVFRKEVKDTVAATRGHIDIITNSMGMVKPEDPVKNLTKRIGGFNRLIDMQMFRINELINQMERMEDLRTGRLREMARSTRKKVNLEYWMEDFIEEMEHADLLDPETEDHDYRSRITTKFEGKPLAAASTIILTRVMRDILRNAIMYSMKATPIEIKVFEADSYVQISVKDEGYGVREKERERVFIPFQRARQPQIISEFGYGLSLYLARNEIEAMNGKLWFDSEEKVGSTFSFKLPGWRDDKAETMEHVATQRKTQEAAAVKVEGDTDELAEDQTHPSKESPAEEAKTDG
ncbi:MAG: HAMP domain-containing sensor histidine kinase [Chloroflexota bacterium]